METRNFKFQTGDKIAAGKPHIPIVERKKWTGSKIWTDKIASTDQN